MKRLFATLYVVVLLTMLAFMVGVVPLLGVVFSSTANQWIFENYRGTVRLLDQRIQNKQDRQTEVDQLDREFGYSVALVSVDGADLTARQQIRLREDGAVVFDQDDADFAYFRSNVDEDLLWKIQLEMSESDDAHLTVIGTMRLLADHLRQFDIDEWPRQLDALSPEFGLSLSLIASDVPELAALTEQQKKTLNLNKVVGVNLEDATETYYYRIPDQQAVIKAYGLPVTQLPVYLTVIVVALFAALFGLAIYLWMRPLWHNLISLERASTEFGQGRFTSRAAVSRFSPIKPISQSFNAMADRIDSLISSHKELTSAVSHELRTPLARMRFAMEMLNTTTDSTQITAHVSNLKQDVIELDTLISELLTYARFERAKPELKPTPHRIVPWLEEQVARAQRQTREVAIQFSSEGGDRSVECWFENLLLARAVSNILQNALRYATSTIVVRVSVEEGQFRIKIDDDGDGIPESKWKSIFDPFSRADESRSRDTGGFGVGLAVVDQIAKWHLGTVSVQRAELGGASFEITIPQATV